MGNNARRAERRRERDAEYEAEDEKRRQEERRKASLTMWERIEEAEISADLRIILHKLAEQCGLEN